jgi:hypothetical protein
MRSHHSTQRVWVFRAGRHREPVRDLQAPTHTSPQIRHRLGLETRAQEPQPLEPQGQVAQEQVAQEQVVQPLEPRGQEPGQRVAQEQVAQEQVAQEQEPEQPVAQQPALLARNHPLEEPRPDADDVLDDRRRPGSRQWT